MGSLGRSRMPAAPRSFCNSLGPSSCAAAGEATASAHSATSGSHFETVRVDIRSNPSPNRCKRPTGPARWRLFRGAAGKRIVQEADDPGNDGGVGDIEDVPPPPQRVQRNEINHGAISGPVDGIAQRPADEKTERRRQEAGADPAKPKHEKTRRG